MTKPPTTEFSSPSATAVAGGLEGSGQPASGTGFFGHPRGLATLFFTEMWERFSYYGIRALLVLFMTAAATGANPGLGMTTARAGAIYGIYVAFVYMLALPGGWIADKLIGQRKAVFYGGVLIALGNFSLAVPDSMAFFYLGLLLITLGTGLLKPNVSTMVGELYPEGGARRDAGFSIFYMGINMGAFFSPLVAGALGEQVNWHIGFAVAGVGMILGLVQYQLGARHLGTAGLQPDVTDAAAHARNWRNLMIGLGVAAAVVAALYFSGVSVEAVAEGIMYFALGLTAAYFIFLLAGGGLNRQEKGRVAAIGVLFISALIFWAGFDQAATSLNLVARDLTDRSFFGFEIPASTLQSVNPLFIIAFAPVFAWFWVWLARRNLEPSSPGKFAIGIILMALGFVVVMFGTQAALSGGKMLVYPLLLTYFLHTLAELFLSPVGLSTVTKLSPHRMVGQMMGIWFMAAALGNLIAGLVAGRLGAGHGGEISPALAVDNFKWVAIIAIGYALVLALMTPLIKRMMGGVK